MPSLEMAAAMASAGIPRNSLPPVAVLTPVNPPLPEGPPPVSTVQTDARVIAFSEILSCVPPAELEAALWRCGIAPLPELVEAVLRLSYSSPASAIKFFRWSGLTLKHTPLAWNLMVDILARNGLFDAMWNAIRSMKQESALSTATFVCAFQSYCAVGRVSEAVMSFDVMDRFGIPHDSFALNSLLAAILRHDCNDETDTLANAAVAADFFDRVKSRVPVDADTFAILLEGWEREGNLARAKNTFGDMIIRIGWDAANMSAYDAFLATLVRGGQPNEAIKFLKVMKSKSCLPGLKFFANALDILIKSNDSVHALQLWDIMVGDAGVVPSLIMSNAMVVILCNNNNIDAAYRLLDEMPFHGSFPDSLTYNAILECLVRNKRAREAERFLSEMRKNEQPPHSSNCAAAISMFFEQFDPSAAVEVWNCVVEEQVSPDDECANELLVGLRDLGRLPDVRRYAEDMLDRGIELRSSTMVKLKSAFLKAGKPEAYDRIRRRLRPRS